MIKSYKDIEKLLATTKGFDFYIGFYPNYYCKVKISTDEECYVTRTITKNASYVGTTELYEELLNKYFTGYRQKDNEGTGDIYKWLYYVRAYINKEKYLFSIDNKTGE